MQELLVAGRIERIMNNIKRKEGLDIIFRAWLHYYQQAKLRKEVFKDYKHL